MRAPRHAQIDGLMKCTVGMPARRRAHSRPRLKSGASTPTKTEGGAARKVRLKRGGATGFQADGARLRHNRARPVSRLENGPEIPPPSSARRQCQSSGCPAASASRAAGSRPRRVNRRWSRQRPSQFARRTLEHFSVDLLKERARRQYGDRCGRSRSPSRSDGGDPAAILNTQNGEATQGKSLKNALETALKVIADHIRACAFLITDGVIPSNEGRGYVLRRIIRRAIRHGYQLGCKTPFFHALVVDLAREMGSAYPELAAAQRRTTDILHQEEARFFETIASGMAMLEAELSSIAPRVHARSDMVSPLLSGELAFK